ncbi:MAG: N-(5'-phosphoribosyl)anthranilate isomerase [Rhodobacteraceae bacterium]|nr:N-(5'-phosphoribosyl)anthranilate isomerase [Paracoccaceae bacterium]
MNAPSRPGETDRFLTHLFSAQSARTGGVVRRKIGEVERKIGRARLELEVRRRGYHLIECGGQFVIVCSNADIRLVC